MNPKRYLLAIILLIALFQGGWAQEQNIGKLSITTQIFLDEMSGKLSHDNLGKPRFIDGVELKWQGRPPQRLIASPDTIDGQAYISAFIYLNNIDDLDALKALGVEVQSLFKESGLLTALIPVDRVLDVAEIENVKRIEVAHLMTPSTDQARQQTHVDDVLTRSADAQRQGLDAVYDGSGVVLGIIDCGIDFQHIAFKKSDGTSRICRAYVYDGSSATTYTPESSNSPTTDDNTGDHGTHTATTAGGSSVIVSGNNVTVTDNHAQATYGGMAPGASLFLAGVKGLYSTYLTNAVSAMVGYADSNNMPLVVSHSWGSQWGPHDGTGSVANVYNNLFSDNHPNRIALFSTGNDAGNSKDGEGGGYHVFGNASSTYPLGTVLRSATYIDADGGCFYQGLIANAFVRTPITGHLGVKIYVLDANTGAVLTSVTMNQYGLVTGLSNYYSDENNSDNLYVYFDQISSNKTQLILYSEDGITSRSIYRTTVNGENYYRSYYTLAIEVYPISSNTTVPVDIWGGQRCYFTDHLQTADHTWTDGSDDMCVSDNATIANVISVGAYVSKTIHSNYQGTYYDASSTYTMGDIAPFSSYATPEASPTGLQYPWITAPGARLAAGVNHYHTANVDNNSYYNRYSYDLVVNSATSPYAMMEGTSMATPVAAGIVALWLQQANAHGQSLTTSDVKNIMRCSAINDDYTTTGANASHFGNGKINALGYVLPIWQGSGTEQNPYLIRTTDEMDWLANSVNCGNDYAGKYFRLANDISYNATPNNYTPIGYGDASGNPAYAFAASFDGDGHTISGIVAGSSSDCDTYQGVFGYVGAAGNVTNLKVAGSTFTGCRYVGAVAGSNAGTVSGCTVESDVTVVATGSNAMAHGGVVGFNAGTVSSCISSVSIAEAVGTVATARGGIVGSNDEQATVSGCFAKGVVMQTNSDDTFSGAIIGASIGTQNLANNYYYHSELQYSQGNSTITSGIGFGGDWNSGSRCDITANNGAVEVFKLTLSDNITASGESITHDSKKYCVANAAVSLGISAPSGSALSPVAVNDGTDPLEIVAVNQTSGAYSLTMPAADVTVFPGVAINVDANSWYAIAPPLHDDEQSHESISNIINLTNGSYDLFRYNESTGTWENQKSSGTGFNVLERGHGYIYRRANASTLAFTGSVNSGPVNVTLSASCVDLSIKGFNLIGNPYPHNVQISRPGFTLQPNGTWLAQTNTVLSAGQAALVQTSEPDILSFSDQLPAPAKDNPPAIAITVTNGEYEDVAYALFDRGDGLRKIAHLNDKAPALSIPMDDIDYAIASLDGTTEVFPLNLHAANGEYTVTLNPTGPVSYCHLIDNAIGKDIDMLDQPTYTFTHSGSNAIPNRFLVKLSPGSGNATFAYQSGNSIVVNGEGELQVFDVAGRRLSSLHLDGSRTCDRDALGIQHSGVYLLRLIGKEHQTQKLIVR